MAYVLLWTHFSLVVIVYRYAYLMESIPLRYQLSQHCDLMEVGGELDSKGYGIGVPKNSPFRDMLSDAILRLSERQILLNLYNKWWNVSKFGTQASNIFE